MSAVLGLCCCTRAFFSCRKQGLLFAVVCGLLVAGASRCTAQALGTQASAAAAHRFGSCASQVLACASLSS